MVGTSHPSVAVLFGKMKKALPKSRSSKKPSGVSRAIVLQNAFLGNLRSGRQANHHASAPIGTMNKSRLHVYPRRVGLSEDACKNPRLVPVRNANAPRRPRAAAPQPPHA